MSRRSDLKLQLVRLLRSVEEKETDPTTAAERILKEFDRQVRNEDARCIRVIGEWRKCTEHGYGDLISQQDVDELINLIQPK